MSIAVAAGFATLAVAGPASAQAFGPVPVHPVTLTASEPGVTITIRDKRGIIECGERCALQLPTGDYKLVVRDPQGNLWTQRLSVVTPISAVVSPPDQGTRRLGIALTMAGALGISAGYITFLVIAWQKYVESLADCVVGSCERKDFATSTYVIAAASLAVGAALGATGLVLWRGSSHAVLRSNAPDAPAATTGAALSLTPAAGHRWAGLALMGSF